MTIFDLNWHPELLRPGFCACARFEDGITAHMSSGDGEHYNLVIDGRGRGHKHHNGLTRERANELLTHYEREHSL